MKLWAIVRGYTTLYVSEKLSKIVVGNFTFITLEAIKKRSG